MRYTLLLLLLCVVSIHASSLFQSVFQSSSSQLEDELLVQVNNLLDKDPNDAKKNCKSCINLLQIMKRLAMFPENVQLATMTNICKRTKQVDDEVCAGVVREQGPVIRKVLKTMDISGRDGHLLCASVLNSCPYPEVKPWKVPFPKKKPLYPYIPPPSNKTMNVLHLSDWHIDPLYEEGTETQCNKPICCRKEYTNTEHILQEASPWGSFGCDSPLSLIESMLEYIPSVVHNPAFGIMTGDIPPHEVWDTLPIEKTRSIQDASYSLLHVHFDTPFFINASLYPSIGNHESAPTNLFPLFDSNLPRNHDELSMRWLYDTLKENWEGWIAPKHLAHFHRHSGSYVTHPVPGLTLISLNTNFCYNLNWWLYEQPVRRDPNGLLLWLVQHLQDAEDKEGERVWIIGHTPPGDSSCFHDYSNYYYQIVDRYAPHVIAGQFFGHTHRDEIQLFYKVEGSQKAKDAISVAYLAPSITPFPDLNPGFRSYVVDTGNFEVIEAHTYIADLDKSQSWDKELNWHLEYSAKEAYGHASDIKPLSPGWWHQVSERMETEDDMFERYWLYRYKSSPFTPDCDKKCRTNVVCGMRAGKSELRCDYDPSSSTPRRPVILDRKEKDACGFSLFYK